jgi:hypothetical protein
LAEGMMSFPVKHHLLDFLHEEVSNDWRSWWTHSHINLVIELASETEVWGHWALVERPWDILFKMLMWQTHGLPNQNPGDITPYWSLTIISFAPVRREPNLCTKSIVLLAWRGKLPVWEPSRPQG